MEAVGAVDEANAWLGMLRSHCSPSHADTLLQIQKDLYGLMAELSAAAEHAEKFRAIDTGKVSWLEQKIAEISAGLPELREFIVPGDHPAGAMVDVARTVIRRAERRCVALHLEEPLDNPALLAYLNRLSSYCFTLELAELERSKPGRLTKAAGDAA